MNPRLRAGMAAALLLSVGISCDQATSDPIVTPAPPPPPPPPVIPTLFDMGPALFPPFTAQGYTTVHPGTIYTPELGFGWTSVATKPESAIVRPPLSPAVPYPGDERLVRTLVTSASDLEFRVDVVDSDYDIVVLLGDPGLPGTDPAAFTPREKLDVLVNGTPVLEDAFSRTLTKKASLSGPRGAWKRIRFRAAADSGAIVIRFHCDGAGTSLNAVMGIELHVHEDPVIALDPESLLLVASEPQAVLLADALGAFNAHDYTAARDAFSALEDPVAKAWGLAWLAGWLTGDDWGSDDLLLAQAEALLQGADLSARPASRFLLEDITVFRKACHYHETRGYTMATVPASAGNAGGIIENLATAAMLFEQLPGAVGGGSLLASPLGFEAAFRRAITMWSRWPLSTEPENAFITSWTTPVKEELLGPLTGPGLFPASAELPLLAKVIDYIGQGKPITDWALGGDVAPSTVPTWWDAQVQVPDHPGAPAWANEQRKYWRALNRAGDWWIEKRLVAGELGGGTGDDVEAASLAYGRFALDEGPSPFVTGMGLVLEQVLYGPEVDQDQGYFGLVGGGDVEHAAEYTSNPMYFLLEIDRGNPAALDMAALTIRNMDETKDASPWTVLLPGSSDRRNFRSWSFGAADPPSSGIGRDIPLNLRAIRPGFALVDYNGCSRARTLLEQLARGWALHASKVGPGPQGKRAGIFPQAVDPVTLGFGGLLTPGLWWKNDGYYDLGGDDGSAIYYNGALYALMLTAYRGSGAADKHVLLEPVIDAGELVYANPAGSGEGEPGWTVAKLKAGIATALAVARPFLAREKSALPASPIAAKINLAHVDQVIQAHCPDPYLRMLALGKPPDGTAVLVAARFKSARIWMEEFWPLATTWVSYTDRIFHSPTQAFADLLETTRGGPFTIEGAPSGATVSWRNPVPGSAPLDIAVFVTGVKDETSVEAAGDTSNRDELDAWLFNFEDASRDIAMRIWRNIDFGIYDVSVNGVLVQAGFAYSVNGQEFVFKDLPGGTMHSISFRGKPAPPPLPAILPDPAICARDVSVDPAAKTVTVRVHNVGNAELAGAAIRVLQGGVEIGSGGAPAIPASVESLSPAPKSVTIAMPPFDPALPLTVRVEAGVDGDLNPYNNEVVLEP